VTPDRAEWTDASSSMGECGRCHERQMVRWTTDPFLSQIHDRDEWSYWCLPCYELAADEI
jgi:hypothetical protein